MKPRYGSCTNRKTLLSVLVINSIFNHGALLISAAGFFRWNGSTTPSRVNASKTQTEAHPNMPSPPERPQPQPQPLESSAKLSLAPDNTTMSSRFAVREYLSSLMSRIGAPRSVTCAKKQELAEIVHRFWNAQRPMDENDYLGLKRQDHMTNVHFVSGGAEPEGQGDPTSTITEGVAADPTALNGNAKPSSSMAFLSNLENLRKRSLQMPKSLAQENGPMMQKMKSAAKHAQRTSCRLFPSFLTTLSLLYTADNGMSFLSLYALALLGASCGFHLFLHFITIGYALGIGLPLVVALFVYNKHSILPPATFLHSMITILWSVRMLSFFVWREYFSWPALHEKVVEIQQRMAIPFASRLLCWMVYSFFYLAMMSMTWSRLQQGTNAKWGLLGLLGLLMQIGGLSMETIADLQKNGFKSRSRHAWCNVGLWKWSTHPNYLGEGFFWWGTYLSHGFYSLPRTIFATIGLGFIMSVLKGSTKSLSMKHMEKYGDQPAFFEFQRTHSIWGPKQWWWWLHGMEHLSEPSVIAYTAPEGNSTINNTTTSSTSLEDNTTAAIGAM